MQRITMDERERVFIVMIQGLVHWSPSWHDLQSSLEIVSPPNYYSKLNLTFRVTLIIYHTQCHIWFVTMSVFEYDVAWRISIEFCSLKRYYQCEYPHSKSILSFRLVSTRDANDQNLNALSSFNYTTLVCKWIYGNIWHFVLWNVTFMKC